MRAIDITGQRFDRLVVIKSVGGKVLGVMHGEARLWLCRCDCGGERLVQAAELRTAIKKDRGIGCLKCKTQRKSEAMTVHGGVTRSERLYKVHRAMMDRCYLKTLRNYRWYGARGIMVCDEWHSYELFRLWALQNGYAKGLSIDRVNVDGNYEPTNCQWVTYAVNRYRQSNPNWAYSIPVLRGN